MATTTDTTPRVDGRSLRDRVAHLASTLTSQERRTAEAMIDDDELIFRPINEFAARHGLGYGSVARTCKKLGYEGFHDLKIQRALELAPAPSGASAPEPIHQEAARAIEDIRTASRNLLEGSIDAAARGLAKAGSILVIGCAGSDPTAREVEYRLARYGLKALAVSDSHMQCIRAASLTAKDVLVAVSSSGATKHILRAVQVAQRRKALVIALTNAGGSPLAQGAGVALLTGMRVDPLRAEVASKVAVDFCLDVLFDRLATIVPDRGAVQRTAQAVARDLL
jgi:RpiR family carbohydrate utilization transcriptional regulator